MTGSGEEPPASGYLRRVSAEEEPTNCPAPPWNHSLGCFCPFCWLSRGKSASLLSSQMGTFRSHDGDYFIEPLQSVDEQEDEEEQNKPHIIYRHSTPQREPSTGKHACATSGICLLVKYRCGADVGSLPRCKEAVAFSVFAGHHSIQYGLVLPPVR